MEALFIYHAKVTAALFISYAFYFVFLRKEKSFAANRLFIMVSLLVSAMLPFIPFSDFVGNSTLSINLNEVIVGANNTETTMQSVGDKTDNVFSVSLYLGYIIVCILLGVLFFKQIISILRLIKNNIVTNYNGVKLIELKSQAAAFSFLNYFFINREDLSPVDFHKIFTHEQAHIQQLHSLDILVLEFMKIIFWYNPVIWLFRKSLIETHEYLADTAVLKNIDDKAEYQMLLLNQSFGVKLGLINQFNYSLLKKRILMMKSEKSSKSGIIKLIVTMPFIILVLLAIACTQNKEDLAITNSSDIKEKSVTTNKATDLETDNTDPKIYYIAEQMPKYPGGSDSLNKFIATNIKYPEEAKLKKLQGKVYISFVVNTKGKVTDAKVIKSINPILDAEAKRVIEAMPQWKPGTQSGKSVNVIVTIPINFKLN